MLKARPITSVVVVEGSENEFVPKSFHTDSISKFSKQWTTTTIVACVIGIRGTYGCFHELKIAYGYTESKNDLVIIGP
jgi:hypothetical protein